MSFSGPPVFTDEWLESFQVTHTFSDNERNINCIEFSPNGELLASVDETGIEVFNCNASALCNRVRFSEYKIGELCFLNNEHVLHSSVRRYNPAIWYLQIHEKKHERQFLGHKKKITSLSAIPSGNVFLSSSLDQTSKLWDVRSSNPCIFTVGTNGDPLSDISNDGNYIISAVNSYRIKILDMRFLRPNPVVNLSLIKSYRWRSVRFSPDGKHIAICVDGPKPVLIKDCLTRQDISEMEIRENKFNPLEISFTSDSRYILSGSLNGCIGFLNITTNESKSTLYRYLVGPTRCVKFNPRLPMASTASSNVQFWEPVYLQIIY